MKPIRVSFVEPSLAAYRVPFFRALAQEPDLRVKLYYAESGRRNAAPDGFEAHLGPRHTYRVLGHPVYWQPAQLDVVDPLKTDVVSFDWDIHYASLVPALIRAKREGVATILWGHGTSKNDGTIKALPRRALARLADVIVTYSEPARQSYLTAGWPEDRAFCAPNALDQTLIQVAYDSVRRGQTDEGDIQYLAREALDLDADGPLLLFVSRIDRIRRLDVLIEALARLAPRYPALQLAIIGEGEPERSRIETLAAERGVRDRVRFAGAIYDEHALAQWYAASDIVVHPAGLGLSVYHAMGHGRPIVVGDDPGVHGPEAASVIHEETGLRFATDDPDACAAAIARLIDEPRFRNQLGESARQAAMTLHSLDAMVRQFAQAIRAAAAVRRS